MTRVARSSLAAVAVLGLVGEAHAAVGDRRARVKLRITSPAFVPREPIPDGFTCDGAGATPPLAFAGVPRRASELALVVDDPDAPAGTFVHWVLWGIDPGTRGLDENAVPETVLEGTNSAGGLGYQPPCPPAGDGSHRYRFTLYALAETPDLDEGATAADLKRAIRGSVLARARLVGTYSRDAGAA